MMPGHELAAGIKARLDVMRGHRTELTRRKVVLAAPDHLDGLAERFRQAHRLEHHVLRSAAPAIAATHDVLMEGDLAAVDAKKARDVVVQPGRVLRADPDLCGLAV